MPVKIQDNLPAISILREENIFVMPASRAGHQDIRPLHIAILNLMPTKVVTETQLLRLLGNTPLQVEVTFRGGGRRGERLRDPKRLPGLLRPVMAPRAAVGLGR